MGVWDPLELADWLGPARRRERVLTARSWLQCWACGGCGVELVHGDLVVEVAVFDPPEVPGDLVEVGEFGTAPFGMLSFHGACEPEWPMTAPLHGGERFLAPVPIGVLCFVPDPDDEDADEICDECVEPFDRPIPRVDVMWTGTDADGWPDGRWQRSVHLGVCWDRFAARFPPLSLMWVDPYDDDVWVADIEPVTVPALVLPAPAGVFAVRSRPSWWSRILGRRRRR